jgi:hypothetical protein
MTKLQITPRLGEWVTVEYTSAASGEKRRLYLDCNFTIEGELSHAVVDTNRYVSVRTSQGSRYTYRDPGLALEVGDVVRVPFGAGNTPVVGTIAAVDTDSPPVGYVKDVLAVANEWVEA